MNTAIENSTATTTSEQRTPDAGVGKAVRCAQDVAITTEAPADGKSTQTQTQRHDVTAKVKEDQHQQNSSGKKSSTRHTTVTAADKTDASAPPGKQNATAAHSDQQSGEGKHNKKQQLQHHAHHHDHKKGSKGSPGRKGATNKKQEKKGSWKRLDVDINFNNNKENQQQSAGSATAAGGTGGNDSTGGNRQKAAGGRGKTNRGHQDHKKDVGQGRHHRHPAGRGGGCGARRGNGGAKSDKPDDTGKWRKRSRGAKGSRSQPQYPHQKDLPLEVAELARAEAVHQVEYFFSADELSRNPWLRRHMDVEGYVPAAVVFNFPSVAHYGIPYYDLISNVVRLSDKLEVDEANETIRIKGDYKKWLYPNEEGGFGCPRWIKVDAQDTAEEAEVSEECVQETPEDVTEKDNHNIASEEGVLTDHKGPVVTFDELAHHSTNMSHPGASSHVIKGNDDSTSGSAPDLTHCTDSDTDGESR